MLFSTREGQSTDTCYKVKEHPKCYAKWKKLDTKDHMCDSIYMKSTETKKKINHSLELGVEVKSDCKWAGLIIWEWVKCSKIEQSSPNGTF